MLTVRGCLSRRERCLDKHPRTAEEASYRGWGWGGCLHAWVRWLRLVSGRGLRPNVALGACDAPNAALGAWDAPNVAVGRIAAANERSNERVGCEGLLEGI
ncbi:hypothetical protein GCM10009565_28980 [Amycolatopsis albidoflavus]